MPPMNVGSVATDAKEVLEYGPYTMLNRKSHLSLRVRSRMHVFCLLVLICIPVPLASCERDSAKVLVMGKPGIINMALSFLLPDPLTDPTPVLLREEPGVQVADLMKSIRLYFPRSYANLIEFEFIILSEVEILCRLRGPDAERQRRLLTYLHARYYRAAMLLSFDELQKLVAEFIRGMNDSISHEYEIRIPPTEPFFEDGLEDWPEPEGDPIAEVLEALGDRPIYSDEEAEKFVQMDKYEMLARGPRRKGGNKK